MKTLLTRAAEKNLRSDSALIDCFPNYTALCNLMAG